MSFDRLTCEKIAVFAVVAMVVTAGCNGSNQGEIAPVSGRVTLDGQPVTSGYVYTTPEKGGLAMAKIAEDGTFRLGTGKTDGAAIGKHSVMLSPIPKREGGAPEGAIVPPDRYGSASAGLVMNVPPEGLSDHLIELESRPEDRRRASRPEPIE